MAETRSMALLQWLLRLLSYVALPISSSSSSSSCHVSLRNSSRQYRRSSWSHSTPRRIRISSRHNCWRLLRRQWWWGQQRSRLQRLTFQVMRDRTFLHLPGRTLHCCSPSLHIYWVHSTTHSDVTLFLLFYCCICLELRVKTALVVMQVTASL